MKNKDDNDLQDAIEIKPGRKTPFASRQEDRTIQRPTGEDSGSPPAI